MTDLYLQADAPLVTVYLPTKNRAAMVVCAVASVLRQTYGNIELILVDDGSTDDTGEKISNLATRLFTESRKDCNGTISRWKGTIHGKERRFVYIRSVQSVGAQAARNTAIAAAQGEYITGLDDDDEFLPGRIVSLMKAFDEQYSCVASTTYVRTRDPGIPPHVDASEHIQPEAGDAPSRYPVRKSGTGRITLEKLLHYNRIGNQVLTLTRRIRVVGGFNPEMPAFQDYDLWVRLVARFGTCLKIPTPTYILDQNPERDRISSTSARKLKALDTFLARYSPLMNPGHLKSMNLIRAELTHGRVRFADLIMYACPGNYRAACIKYIRGLQS